MATDQPAPLELLAAVLDEAFQVGARIVDDGALYLRMDGDLAVTVTTSPDGVTWCSIHSWPISREAEPSRP
ncbi:hypothetical protein CCP4SC76_3400002 [Gammaproteobacteria bacterium]